MFGAVYGDIIGSYYELHCTKDYNFKLMAESSFTDDSVLTAAVCKAIIENNLNISFFDINKRGTEYAVQYKSYYSRYKNAGFGEMFTRWAKSSEMFRQKSYGNGAAMRVVPIGYAYSDIKQICRQVRASCIYTHNNFEAIKGAEAVAVSVRMALDKKSKKEIQSFCEKKFGFALDTAIDEIRKNFVFDSRTKYSVPPAIIAFLQSDDYESAVRNAVSLGGDADTMACIAGGIAEAYYGKIPEYIKRFCDSRLDSSLRSVFKEFCLRSIVK